LDPKLKCDHIDVVNSAQCPYQLMQVTTAHFDMKAHGLVILFLLVYSRQLWNINVLQLCL